MCFVELRDDRGSVKGSLRTQRDDVNLSDIAQEFGGGGHPKASGFGLPGRLEPEISWKIVPENGSAAHGKEVDGDAGVSILGFTRLQTLPIRAFLCYNNQIKINKNIKTCRFLTIFSRRHSLSRN